MIIKHTNFLSYCDMEKLLSLERQTFYFRKRNEIKEKFGKKTSENEYWKLVENEKNNYVESEIFVALLESTVETLNSP